MKAAVADDKRARILDAALTEFAERGYERASTNAIAARAEAAKGLVFHYFGSKEELFLAVADDVVAHLLPRFEETLARAPRDLFERVLVWTEMKLQLLKEDPRRLRFFLVALVEAPEPVQAETRARAERLMRSLLARFTEGIDPARLRPGVTAAQALEAIWLVSSGFERTLMPLFAAGKQDSMQIVEHAMAQARRVFQLLRDGVYSR